MAIGFVQQTDKVTAYLNKYVADTEADIATLPTNVAPGSSCVVVATGNQYMLNNQHKWICLPQTGSGSGSGTLDADWGTIGDSSAGLDSNWGTIGGSTGNSSGDSWGSI